MNDMKLKGDEKCIYCGMSATTRDHFIPWSYNHSSSEKRTYNNDDVLPCCRECNILAGNKIFETLEEKRYFIHARIATKYKKVLAMPFWTEEEVNELSGKMKKTVVMSMKLKCLIEARLKWPYNWFEENGILRKYFDDLFE